MGSRQHGSELDFCLDPKSGATGLCAMTPGMRLEHACGLVIPTQQPEAHWLRSPAISSSPLADQYNICHLPPLRSLSSEYAITIMVDSFPPVHVHGRGLALTVTRILKS